GDKIARENYAAGFVLPLVLKDVRLALAEVEKAGAPMPTVSVVRDRLITGIARGYGELDWMALGLIAAEEAGLSAVPPLDANCEGTCPPLTRLKAHALEEGTGSWPIKQKVSKREWSLSIFPVRRSRFTRMLSERGQL